MYKMVVLDIDGTLLNSKHKLTRETKIAIHKCLNRNIPVCLCTGRNVFNTRYVLKNLNLTTPYVCMDGTVMFDPLKNKPMIQKNIPNGIFSEIVSEIDKENLYLEFCNRTNYFKYIKSEELALYNYGGVETSIYKSIKNYLLNNVRHIKNLDNFAKKNKEVNMLLYAGELSVVNKVKSILQSKNYDCVDIRDNLWENYVFVVPKAVNKASGVRLLCEHYNIDMSEVIAIGDQMNDIDMIKEVGFGVAMGNAHEEIKRLAKYITLSNDEDGIAHVINKFVINVNY